MRRFFYSKLAIINIKKNAKFYFPYLITSIGTVAMFYIMTMITTHPGLNQMTGAEILRSLMFMGSIIIGIFATNLIFYTNNFLMRRRNKEIGLYNILGMEKRHIARILFHETIFVLITSIGLGILGGILFGRLLMLVLYKIVNFKTSITPYISKISIISSIILFGVIFLLCLIVNLTKIKLAKPIELLKGSQVGEKEPKTKWLISLIGFICIGTGYYIAITTKSPLDALVFFFLAVLLVVIGTYCLFTAGSIFILKMLRKNKKFYYKTNHFTAISGMLYRMKQNAMGLSNICILCTMVLVMVSGTLSLYIGMTDALNNRYPKDILVRTSYKNPDKFDTTLVLSAVEDGVENNNSKIISLDYYHSLSCSVDVKGNKISFSADNFLESSDAHEMIFLSLDDYNQLVKRGISLNDDEVLVYNKDKSFGDSMELIGTSYQVKEELTKFPMKSENEDFMTHIHYVVMPDVSHIERIFQQQMEAYKKDASLMKSVIYLDITGTEKEKIETYKAIKTAIEDWKENTSLEEYSIHKIYTESKQEMYDMGYFLYGGFLFLGSFLGLLFIMATVLIMYYKQISEGFEDKERFSIMQKVGMSRIEVKRSIRSQVLMVFFIPLVVATIHVIAAFPMITKLLAVLQLTNVSLFFACTCGTIIVFAFIYAAVYAVTARTYYKIVG